MSELDKELDLSFFGGPAYTSGRNVSETRVVHRHVDVRRKLGLQWDVCDYHYLYYHERFQVWVDALEWERYDVEVVGYVDRRSELASEVPRWPFRAEQVENMTAS